MMKLLLVFTTIILHYAAIAQQRDLRSQININGYYFFYLHGGVVTAKGDNSINDPGSAIGPYQYNARKVTMIDVHYIMKKPRIISGVYLLKEMSIVTVSVGLR